MEKTHNVWKIIDTYFQTNKYYITRHHLNSYDDFVFNKIPYIISTLNPFVILKDDLRIEVHVETESLDIVAPRYGEDDSPLYPNVARLHNKNYFSDVFADVTIRYYEGDDDKRPPVKEKRFVRRKVASIPVMLHSKLCYLHGLGISTLRELGECPYDQGGYFIVDGKEKVIISQERIATNLLFISDPVDDERDLLEGMIRSTALTNALFPKTVHFWVEKEKLFEKPTLLLSEKTFYIRMKIMHMNVPQERIPVFLIFRALGIESDKDIIKHITLDDEYLQEYLRPSVVDGSTMFTQDGVLDYLSGFVKYKNKEYVKYVILNDLFPNAGDNFRQKALYLGYLVNRLVKTVIGQIKRNKRDNYMFKRVDTTGILIGNIFRDFYNDYRNHVRSTIDREYTLGGMNNRLNIITENNFGRIFPSSLIEKSMYKSMKGDWGLGKERAEGANSTSGDGLVQDLSRLSYVGYVSHVRRVNTPIDRSIKLVEPHRLDTPQFGMMCPIESPDGANIGLLKHLSSTCEISLELDRDAMMDALLDLNMVSTNRLDPSAIGSHTKVFLNNTWVGIHKEPKTLVSKLRQYRRTHVLHAFVSISWKIFENEIYVFSDAGRCCRPLFIVEKLHAVDYDAVKWIDHVAGYGVSVATYDKSRIEKGRSGRAIEYLDCFESDTSYISMLPNEVKVGRHTHCEIHPTLHLSLYTNTIPLANHNQAPRNVFSGAQGKQAIGIYATNFNHRIDTASYVLHYPQRALLSTKMAKYVHKNKMPTGENLIVAIATYSGYNQEDSVILNGSSVARGMFNVTGFKAIVETEEVNNSLGTSILFDNPKRLKKEGESIDFKYANWEKIDDDGLPIKNAHISEDDCYLGMVGVRTKKPDGKDNDEIVFSDQALSKTYQDVSKIAEKFDSGTIDNVVKYEISDGLHQVKIRMRKLRIPELGDKMSSTHGQKGVCGMILPQEDMPYTKNGLVPDIIVNPHAFPSRMTIAHLIESVLAKLGCLNGSYIDGTPFEEHCIDDYYEMLGKHGYNKRGDEIMYNGYTGEQIKTEIFIGPTLYQRLKHMVQDKLNYRSSNGPVEMMTRQPTQGRGNGGGLRIGEMENNAILGHGLIGFIKESMMERSDDYYKYIDSQSGEDIVYNEAQELYSSLYAQKVAVPYSWKLLQQELEAMSIHTKLMVEKKSVP